MGISSRNTATSESNMLENKSFMVCMNVAGAFVSPMGITTQSYRLYLVSKAVFGISLSAIWYCQYQMQISIDMTSNFPSSPTSIYVMAMGTNFLL